MSDNKPRAMNLQQHLIKTRYGGTLLGFFIYVFIFWLGLLYSHSKSFFQSQTREPHLNLHHKKCKYHHLPPPLPTLTFPQIFV